MSAEVTSITVSVHLPKDIKTEFSHSCGRSLIFIQKCFHIDQNHWEMLASPESDQSFPEQAKKKQISLIFGLF